MEHRMGIRAVSLDEKITSINQDTVATKIQLAQIEFTVMSLL
jgi:hypothetical protein